MSLEICLCGAMKSEWNRDKLGMACVTMKFIRIASVFRIVVVAADHCSDRMIWFIDRIGVCVGSSQLEQEKKNDCGYSCANEPR